MYAYAALALLVVFVWWARNARLPAHLAVRRVNVRLDRITPYETVSPEHAARATEALRAFAETYATASTSTHVRRMFALRDVALSSIAEIRMRLPNDLDLDDDLWDVLDHVARATQAALDDVRTRVGTGLQPAPLSDVYETYRAVNA
jgi:hypothetical protein